MVCLYGIFIEMPPVKRFIDLPRIIRRKTNECH
jgi:hypothetical protein